MINIGERLKYIRETYDVSQKELASILGVSHYCISHYERNDYIIPMRKLCAVSNYFQLSIDYILGLADTKNYQGSRLEIDTTLSKERLKQFRKEHGLTQDKLAKLLETTQSVVCGFEKGRNLIARVCK